MVPPIRSFDAAWSPREDVGDDARVGSYRDRRRAPDVARRLAAATIEGAGAMIESLTALGLGWIRCSRAGAVVAANGVADRLLGRAAVGLQGAAAWMSLVDDEFQREALRDAFASSSAGEQRVLNLDIQRGDDEVRHLRLALTPKRVLGRIAHVDIVITDETLLRVARRDLSEAEELIALIPPHVFWKSADISEQRQVQSQLEAMVDERTQELQREIAERQRAEQRAIKANRAKSVFLANMSHELRTPLNVIIGFTDLLLEELDDSDLAARIDALKTTMTRDLGKVRTAAGFLLELICELLDISKIEAGRMELDEQEVDIGEAIDALRLICAPLVARNRSRFEVSIDDDLGRTRVDPSKLRQILLNLLSNAAKFTERGVVRLVVKREQLDGAAWISFAVEDTGIGISADKLESLFEPFVQADSSITRRYGGTGLGLAISKRLCAMMGGTLEVESVLGEGSRFCLRLPVKR